MQVSETDIMHFALCLNCPYDYGSTLEEIHPDDAAQIKSDFMDWLGLQ